MRDLMNAEMPQGGSIIPESVEIRLQRQRDNFQKAINDIDMALSLLKEQPKLLDTLNILRKVGI